MFLHSVGIQERAYIEPKTQFGRPKVYQARTQLFFVIKGHVYSMATWGAFVPVDEIVSTWGEEKVSSGPRTSGLSDMVL